MTVTEQNASRASEGTRRQPSTSPDWSMVPFDVGCARCGHDLRGRSEPKCPACAFEFDWGEAVPIEKLTCATCRYPLYGLTEPRCPECGTAFDWYEALDLYRRRRKNLLEYRWREGIVRATVRTWRALLRPGRFWRNVELYDPPDSRVLIVFAVAMVVAGGLVFNTYSTSEDWLWMRLHTMPGTTPGQTLADYPLMWLTALASYSSWSMLLLIACWSALSLPGLLILRQSMARCHVRNDHVLRVWAYATTGLLVPYMTICALVLLLFRIADADKFVYALTPPMAFAYVFLAGWSVRQGYRHYLRIDHSVGVAVSSQLMAMLGASLLHRGLLELLRHVFWW